MDKKKNKKSKFKKCKNCKTETVMSRCPHCHTFLQEVKIKK